MQFLEYGGIEFAYFMHILWKNLFTDLTGWPRADGKLTGSGGAVI